MCLELIYLFHAKLRLYDVISPENCISFPPNHASLASTLSLCTDLCLHGSFIPEVYIFCPLNRISSH